MSWAREVPSVALTTAERDQFERDGYLLIKGALSDDEVSFARTAVSATRDRAEARGELDRYGAMHRLSAVTSCPQLSFLLNHPRTFGAVWSTLGWNVHVYHSHVDLHPPRPRADVPHWGWHQDGGRQNREIETDPRPRLSVKLAYWLSDVSVPGRGNLMIVPGSLRTTWLDGPPRRDLAWPAPNDAVEVLAEPGDALFFDRRIWHMRSDNHSDITRMAAFFGYTYRWIVCRDDVASLPQQPWWDHLDPVQRQLLGGREPGSSPAVDTEGDHCWGHDPATTPLYRALAEWGALDGGIPALIPDRAAGALSSASL
jgi:ectoine hydroxylase-related dioxygenase (phytanoyl-CoA dioxygenase family)